MVSAKPIRVSSCCSQAVVAVNEQNPLRDPAAFRETFNRLINQKDTSLPTANANDTPEGFIAVLSTAVEMKGVARPNSKELNNIQIQTRYPDAILLEIQLHSARLLTV